MGIFQAWKGEREEIVKLKGEIGTLHGTVNTLNDQLKEVRAARDTLDKPILVGELMNTARFKMGERDPRLMLLVTITNRGAPSSARGFTLSIKTDSGVYQHLPPQMVPDPYELTAPTGKIKFTQKDILYERTAKPIERGGTEAGWLLYLLPDEVFDQLKTGAKLTLSFFDAFGNGYQAFGTIDDNKNVPLYFPGVQPFVPGLKMDAPHKSISRKS